MGIARELTSGAPGATFGAKVRAAAIRAARTLLQGIAGAVPAGGASSAILDAGYWEAFYVACLGALLTAAVSFLQNVASALPSEDG